MAVVLGVPTMVYLPYALFNIASPLVTLLLGFTGFRIEKVDVGEDGEEEVVEALVIHTARP